MIPLSTIERSEHSQNGEDGIVEYLTDRIRDPDRRFLEIGTDRGRQNNTMALVKRGWSGVGVDRKAKRVEHHRGILAEMGAADRVELIALHVGPDNATGLLGPLGTLTPDFFSLDIDSVDWHVWRALSGAGFRPKVVCVEYNPTFGPTEEITVPLDFTRPDSMRNIYFGCSLALWKATLERQDYQFVTVCSDGINAFFVNPMVVQTHYFDAIDWLLWADCPDLIAREGARDYRLARLGDARLERPLG